MGVEDLVRAIEVGGVELAAVQLSNVDGSVMVAGDWVGLTQAIHSVYNEYDGFVIIQGTDTLSYAGAFLSEMIVNPGKPLVLTGAQLPLSQEGSDGIQNLNHAVLVATQKAAGVFCVFDRKVFHADAFRKVDSVHPNAFIPLNGPCAAVIADGQVRWNQNGQDYNTGETLFKTDLCTTVGLLRIFPDISYNQIMVFAAGLRGLVVEAYGIGSMPNAAIRALVDLAHRGVRITVVSQANGGGTHWDKYAVSNLLQETAGIEQGGLMSAELAYAKMMLSIGGEE